MPDSAPTRATLAAPPTGEARDHCAIIERSLVVVEEDPRATGGVHSRGQREPLALHRGMARLCGHEDVFPIANPASMVPLQLRTIRQSRHRATEPPPKRFTRCAARRSKRIDRLPTIDGVPSSARFAGDPIAGNHFQGPGIANPRCTFGSAMPFGSCVLATTSISSSFSSTYCCFSYRDLSSSRSARRGETYSSRAAPSTRRVVLFRGRTSRTWDRPCSGCAEAASRRTGSTASAMGCC